MPKRKPRKRNHDGFFRYIYSKPTNAKALLNLACEVNAGLDSMLKEVDLDSLKPIPGFYSEVTERGESDLAFKASIKGGKEVFVGILLEHKSYTERQILDQLGRYAFNVMVNKNDTELRWYPTKAIVIYNGTKGWDPLADFKQKKHAKFQGKDLPFEFVLVNLSEINNDSCFANDNIEASMGALIMKYAFDKQQLTDRVDHAGV